MPWPLTPPFDLDGGVPMALSRGLSVAGLFLVFGTLLIRAWLAPAVLAAMAPRTAARVRQQLEVLTWCALAAAMVGALGWLWVETGSIADADTAGDTARALPTVLAHTLFGKLVAGRLAALCAAAISLSVMPRRLWLAAAFAGAALSLQAGHSHAAAMYGVASWLLLFDWLHIMAGGAWIGGLFALMLLVRRLEPEAALIASRRFSPIGIACVAIIAISALFQAWVLIGSIPGLLGTANGWIACIKIVLFCMLMGCAAANRNRFTPALRGGRQRDAAATLRLSIGAETGIGLLVVLAAGFLTSLPPAMHLQPQWPFGWWVSLDAVQEDPDIKLEVALATAALLAASTLLGIALFVRRWRLPAAAAFVVAVWFTLPHFQPLLVPAYPTSFFHSPTNFAASSIDDGARLYPENCAICHGAFGQGDGPMAKSLPVPPADLTASHLWMHSDGELFWWLTSGIPAPDGAPSMPGFAGKLTQDQRWHLIDFIRAHNAGVTYQAKGTWPLPLKAPSMDVQCNGQTMALHDLRGAYLLLVIGTPAAPGRPTPIAITRMPANGGAVCTSTDEAAPVAYAVLAGVAPADLPGTQFLIDDAGWLRAAQRPGATPSWNDPAQLAAEISALQAHPVSAADAMDHMDMDMDMSMPMPMPGPMGHHMKMHGMEMPM